MRKSQIFIPPMLVSVSFLVIGTGCGKSTAAAAMTPPLEVRVAGVEQRDVPLYNEWIGTLDGFGNAGIEAQGCRVPDTTRAARRKQSVAKSGDRRNCP